MKRVTQRSADLPFVLVNMAMTADGKIAPADRRFVRLGSTHDLQNLYKLRASADAIMCGARTAAQVASMGPGPAPFRRLRLRRGLAEYPIRVVVSGRANFSPRAPLFQRRFSPIVILTTEAADPRRLDRLRRVADAVQTFGREQIDFVQALRWLRQHWGVRRLLCEGGGELNAALFQAGLVNELHLTICPVLVGGRAAPTIADGAGIKQLAHACRLSLRSMRRVGDELFLVYRVRATRGQLGD
jgi:riboflavin-specific deaminase-like protein